MTGGSEHDKTGVFWRCEICGATRPDNRISVYTFDISKSQGLEPGILTRNVNYCNDSILCRDSAMQKDETNWRVT
jgi:hypothetical protein